jgi:hypothetical protein
MNKTTFFAAALYMACSTSVIAANTDELWEITSAMEMQGMSIPSSTQKSCIGKNQPYKPAPEDKNCTVRDVRISGNKTSWKMQCTGKDAMEGSGVMTKTASSLDGVMTMKSQGEQMTMKMSGRIAGKCDYAAEQKKLNAMVAGVEAQQADALAQSREMQRKSCEETRKSASTNFDSYETYKQYESGSPEMRAYLAKCKVNLETSRKQLCQKATVAEHEFARKHCPDEYVAMKLQHCVGRSGSYRDLCDGTSSGSQDASAAGSNANPAKSILDGAKGLMNVFGF